MDNDGQGAFLLSVARGVHEWLRDDSGREARPAVRARRTGPAPIRSALPRRCQPDGSSRRRRLTAATRVVVELRWRLQLGPLDELADTLDSAPAATLRRIVDRCRAVLAPFPEAWADSETTTSREVCWAGLVGALDEFAARLVRLAGTARHPAGPLPETVREDWKPGRWFVRATGGNLEEDTLRAAARNRRVRVQKKGRTNYYAVQSVMKDYRPDLRPRLERALAMEASAIERDHA